MVQLLQKVAASALEFGLQQQPDRDGLKRWCWLEKFSIRFLLRHLLKLSGVFDLEFSNHALRPGFISSWNSKELGVSLHLSQITPHY